ncbi:MAG: hypothetical protein C0505_15965 [Leptothrix sp. (in: Bacteria)]|nr:hypothetical protein [Leptothrix sp. (in: b-proteobacteria)]
MFTWLSLGSALPSKVAQFSVGANTRGFAGPTTYPRDSPAARQPFSATDRDWPKVRPKSVTRVSISCPHCSWVTHRETRCISASCKQ